VTEDDIAIHRSRSGRLPTAGHAGIEQLVSAGHVIPDGDRRHRAQSGRVVDEAEPVSIERHEHVERVFILLDDRVDQPWW
jgi:hypothetical protein